jgi:hypothetical protein
MLDLGNAVAPDGKSNAFILQRFGKRQEAEDYKEAIRRGCIVRK